MQDFITWCKNCCIIKDKATGKDIPFILNRAQLKTVAILEEERLAGRPIRLIMLKTRQWGGSTLIQAYMAWIQTLHKSNWHSLVCSQVKDTSIRLRSMYEKILQNYPVDQWTGDEPPRLKNVSGAANISEITGRGCQITICSANNQDAMRGGDFAMAHLSEVAFWPETRRRNPADLIRAVCGSIARVPLSLVVLESTANGVGNYFHQEWIRCKKGLGDKRTVFIPWYEIDMNSAPPADPVAFEASLNEYERNLRDEFHCTLDQICWYREKRSEYQTHEQMMSEYPTTDEEAFISTAHSAFARKSVEKLRESCAKPRVGELSAATGEFSPEENGNLKLWTPPEEGAEYVAAVDVGGTTERADYSVVAVMRTDLPNPEVVAQWRGHIHHDILARIAADIGRWYNDALLVIESNTLESDVGSPYVINALADSYPNLYRRRSYDTLTGRESMRVGFHTNRQTKAMIIDGLIAAVRDGTYIERDNDACDELITFRQNPNGSYGATPGSHDDIVMTRAIALHAADCCPTINLPPQQKKFPEKLAQSEKSFYLRGVL